MPWLDAVHDLWVVDLEEHAELAGDRVPDLGHLYRPRVSLGSLWSCWPFRTWYPGLPILMKVFVATYIFWTWAWRAC